MPVKVQGTRWIAHRERGLKILLDGWQSLVIHTSQVAMGSTALQGRAHSLNTTLTNMKFSLLDLALSTLVQSVT